MKNFDTVGFFESPPLIYAPDPIFLESSVTDGIYEALDFVRSKAGAIADEMSSASEFADRIIAKGN